MFFLIKPSSTAVSLGNSTSMFYAENTNPLKKSIKIYIQILLIILGEF